MDNNNNNNSYDLEWEKLREEYKNLIKNSNPEEENNINDENTIKDFNLPELKIENTNEFPSIPQKNDIETLKQEKDLQIQPKKKKQRKTLKDFLKKSIDFTDNILQKIVSKKKDSQIYWTEENRKELSTIIVVFCLIMCFLIITLFVFNIPELAIKFFNLNKNDDIINEENIVYVDETKRSFHNSDCTHLIKGMRYLVLEEKYAIQLGYKPCEKYNAPK